MPASCAPPKPGYSMQRLIVPLLLSAALAAPAAAETRSLSGFTDVSAEGRFRVEISPGPGYQVSVEGPDAARISSRIEGETLKLEATRRSLFGGEPQLNALVRIVTPRLEGAAAARGTVMQVTATTPCSEFGAAAAMGATVTVAGVACDSVDAAAAMGGELRLTGACHNLDAAAAMGGRVDARALECRVVDASAAMGGAIDAVATETYDAAASLGGDVNISGGARAGDQSTALGGSVTQRP